MCNVSQKKSFSISLCWDICVQQTFVFFFIIECLEKCDIKAFFTALSEVNDIVIFKIFSLVSQWPLKLFLL